MGQETCISIGEETRMTSNLSIETLHSYMICNMARRQAIFPTKHFYFDELNLSIESLITSRCASYNIYEKDFIKTLARGIYHENYLIKEGKVKFQNISYPLPMPNKKKKLQDPDDNEMSDPNDI